MMPVVKSRVSAGRVLSALAVAALLGGCAVGESLNERSRIEYKSASKVPSVSLEVPPDLSSPRGDDRFAMPARPTDTTASAYQRDRATARPLASGETRLLPNVEGARIERAGSQRWLVINQPPEKIWPLIREFWQESGFVIQFERPESGIMETDWAENRAKIPDDFIRRTVGRVFDSAFSTGERDRFRTRLEPGSGGTEIYISHRGMVEVQVGQFKETTKWEPRPAEPELEVEFLRRLMVKFGVDQDRARAAQPQPAQAAAAGAAAAPERSRLVSDPAQARVDLVEGFDRAWRRVGLALDRGGFTVEDRDRSQGVYYVRYIDPEIEAKNAGNPGFFGRIFSSGSAQTSSRQYRVKLEGSGEATSIKVLARDGQPVSSEADRQTAVKMLALLHEQLKL